MLLHVLQNSNVITASVLMTLVKLYSWISAHQLSAMVLKQLKHAMVTLFDMYQCITADSPYDVPMKIYPAIHYTMGGLWVDYNLMSNIDGLFVLGEANFSDHGANRLGASALMQGSLRWLLRCSLHSV